MLEEIKQTIYIIIHPGTLRLFLLICFIPWGLEAKCQFSVVYRNWSVTEIDAKFLLSRTVNS